MTGPHLAPKFSSMDTTFAEIYTSLALAFVHIGLCLDSLDILELQVRATMEIVKMEKLVGATERMLVQVTDGVQGVAAEKF